MIRDILNNLSSLIYNVLTIQYHINITFDEVYRKLDKVLSDCNLNDNEIELLDIFLKKNTTIGKINKLLNDLLKSILKDNKIDMNDIPSFILFINEFITIINDFSLNELKLKLNLNVILQFSKCIIITILNYVILKDKENVINTFENIFVLVESSILMYQNTSNNKNKYICC